MRSAAAKPARAAYSEAVLERLRVSTGAVDRLDDGGDAVGLLVPELLGAATTVSPSANAAASATSGSSSIASGTSPAVTCVE